MNKQDLVHLRSLDPCPEAVEWALTQPSAKQAWQRCKRGDWMLWYAAMVGADYRRIIGAVCDCAELGKPYWPNMGVKQERLLKDIRRSVFSDDIETDLRAATDEIRRGAFKILFRSTHAYSLAGCHAALAVCAAADAATNFSSSDRRISAQLVAHPTALVGSAHIVIDGAEGEERAFGGSATICRQWWPTLADVAGQRFA